MLEFLSDDEVELRSACLLSVDVFLEAIGPVDTHESDHGQQNAYADTGRAPHVEGVELLDVHPGITAFKEGQGVDRCGGFEHYGVAEFERHAAVGVGVARRVSGE